MVRLYPEIILGFYLDEIFRKFLLSREENKKVQ